MQFITLDTVDDPRVEAYVSLTEMQLRNRLEPAKGVFIAESPKVIDRALAADREPLSLLVEEPWLEGMKDTKTPTRVIVDRPEAIRWALAHARKEDIIVLMGKGHETYQEVNHVKHHMDERELIADIIRENTDLKL